MDIKQIIEELKLVHEGRQSLLKEAKFDTASAVMAAENEIQKMERWILCLEEYLTKEDEVMLKINRRDYLLVIEKSPEKEEKREAYIITSNCPVKYKLGLFGSIQVEFNILEAFEAAKDTIDEWQEMWEQENK